jgi:hypothetical protein
MLEEIAVFVFKGLLLLIAVILLVLTYFSIFGMLYEAIGEPLIKRLNRKRYRKRILYFRLQKIYDCLYEVLKESEKEGILDPSAIPHLQIQEYLDSLSFDLIRFLNEEDFIQMIEIKTNILLLHEFNRLFLSQDRYKKIYKNMEDYKSTIMDFS